MGTFLVVAAILASPISVVIAAYLGRQRLNVIHEAVNGNLAAVRKELADVRKDLERAYLRENDGTDAE